jgi:hypothetical protein
VGHPVNLISFSYIYIDKGKLPMPRIPERLSDASLRRHQERQKHRGDAFIRGPVPLGWLARAAVLPGSALAVGLAIWFLVGMCCSRKALVVCPTLLLERFNVSRKAGYRGLAALERAGLVKVERHRGRCPRVTILEEANKPASKPSATV